ncbi:MAG: DUF4382 domain-containing protein [Chthonomonadaceae bacterium]|nr:DUF4382 domain-containing protein [Chthonomonadaceae bacterium]
MKRLIGIGVLLSAVVLAGCGGGGGTSSVASGGSRASVILTDSPREDYAHVWATIYHVELVPQSGSAVVLFDDPTGRLIDLKTLRDATGQRFNYLASATVSAGTYTGLTVSVGSTMQLYRNGAATGNPLTVDASLPKDTLGHPILTETFTPSKVVTPDATNFIVDFDLASFKVTGTTILPVIIDGVKGNVPGLHDPSRHNKDEYHGTVSGITGTSPTLTFTLTRGRGQTISVTTTASTSLYGTTTLAEGSIVEVTGTLDTTAQTLVATAVEVRPTTDPEIEHSGTCAPHVSGTATALDATAGTFTVTTTRVRGFTPTSTTVNVVTTGTTVYRADHGATETQAAFFTALATTPNVRVEGTYDATTNTLTATSLQVNDPRQDGGWGSDHHDFRHGSDSGHWGNGVSGRH